MAVSSAQTNFCGLKESRTDTGATSLWKNVDSDDVSYSALVGFGDDETDRSGARLGHDGEGIATFDVGPELDPRVRDPRKEALLIDFPEGLEVLGAKIAEGEVHGLL